MLGLTRKSGESIILTVPASTVPVRISVTVGDVRGGRVKLGVDCPRHVIVHREEIQAAVDKAREGKR